MEKKVRRIIIDTDPGIDDAVALAAASFSKELKVELITTVAGNVSIDKTTDNALKLMEFFKKDTPVAKGAGRPLIRTPKDASHIHGDSGMAGYEFPEPKGIIEEKNAVDKIREVLMASDEKITIVTIGPLTNMALLLNAYPECKDKIEEIITMGGSSGRGNDTPAAEFNIYADPEAARIVINAGVPMVMCPLDVTSVATLDLDTINALKTSSKVGEMFYELFNHYRGGSVAKGGLKMHDLTTIAYLTKPELFKSEKCFVDVETQGEYTAGFTVVDLKDVYKKEKNVEFCTEIDVIAFRKWMLDLFKSVEL